jgi:hypothetical protein
MVSKIRPETRSWAGNYAKFGAGDYAKYCAGRTIADAMSGTSDWTKFYQDRGMATY